MNEYETTSRVYVRDWVIVATSEDNTKWAETMLRLAGRVWDHDIRTLPDPLSGRWHLLVRKPSMFAEFRDAERAQATASLIQPDLFPTVVLRGSAAEQDLKDYGIKMLPAKR